MRFLITLVSVLCSFLIFAQPNSESWIYGKITTWEGDTYEGQLRWGKEEALWTDIFNAGKIENENISYLDNDKIDDIQKNRSWSNNNYWGRWVNKSVSWVDNDFTHQFACQFGDIKQIKKKSKSKVELTFRDDTVIKLSGQGYNDVGAKIRAYVPEIGNIEIEWDDIETVEFKSAPNNWESKIGEPLYGVVESWTGKYEGFIAWDEEERVGSDKLDGETNNADMSIEFSNIASIESSGNSCQVTLKNGKSYRMGGTNDVNGSNRGIVVSSANKGRVIVDWNDFDKLTFTNPPKNSGNGLSSFKAEKIKGTITTKSGKTLKGNLVYDLDEAYTYELLNGKIKDTEFEIPFRNIKSIEPRGYDECQIILKSGDKFNLEDSQDVDSKNTGILVFENGSDKEPTYVAWQEVVKIEIE